MNLDIKTLDVESLKFTQMNELQSRKEIEYKMSLKLLEILKRKEIISDIEYNLIDELNRQSFSPILSKIYL